MMTRTRRDDAPAYDPHSDRSPSPWNRLDTVAQRIIACAAAAAILLALVAWIGKTLSTDQRLTALEAEVRQLSKTAAATKNVACFLARKSDQPITPPECNAVTP